MDYYKSTQPIGQLEKRRGGYFYIKIQAEVIAQFPQKRKTRFLCTLMGELTFQCGLNHMGDGNFFIILSSKNLKKVGKALGDTITFELCEDPNPLGVPIPEVLTVLLDQDEALKLKFDKLSLSNKRHLIHTTIKLKDIDKQVANAMQMIDKLSLPRKKH